MCKFIYLLFVLVLVGSWAFEVEGKGSSGGRGGSSGGSRGSSGSRGRGTYGGRGSISYGGRSGGESSGNGLGILGSSMGSVVGFVVLLLLLICCCKLARKSTAKNNLPSTYQLPIYAETTPTVSGTPYVLKVPPANYQSQRHSTLTSTDKHKASETKPSDVLSVRAGLSKNAVGPRKQTHGIGISMPSHVISAKAGKFRNGVAQREQTHRLYVTGQSVLRAGQVNHGPRDNAVTGKPGLGAGHGTNPIWMLQENHNSGLVKY